MADKSPKAPHFRRLAPADITRSFRRGLQDVLAAPLTDMVFAGVFVLAGLVMTWVTYATGHTFWLVLAVLGFPMVGSLAAVGFYEVSRARLAAEPFTFQSVARRVWQTKNGQLPWLAAIIVVIFLFWFFLGHMIFALFLGLAPMTNISTSLGVFASSEGLMMLAVGSLVGAVFVTFVFAMTLFGMPLIIDRDIDFITAMLTSISAVAQQPLFYLVVGAMFAVLTIASMVPMFAGLFVAMPVLGHMSWHLYRAATEPTPTYS